MLLYGTCRYWQNLMQCLMLEVFMIRSMTVMIITRKVLKRFLDMASTLSSVVLVLFTRYCSVCSHSH